MSDTKNVWIARGYEVFALHGAEGVKIEKLARDIGRNKSSFYHHFATQDIFVTWLLAHHLDHMRVMANKLQLAADLPELVAVLMQHPTDLLFNRALRVARQNTAFEACFLQTNQFVGDAIAPVLLRIVGIESNAHLSRLVLWLTVENFLLRITPENLNPEWLNNFFNQLKISISEFTGLGAVNAPDGAV